ncbi:MAG TPA: FAD-binding oxidoreductase [Steroidobacteraceae bacterium]|nr:FAD-binding oxidoreductase [Steroidobacteraceae bacterium]
MTESLRPVVVIGGGVMGSALAYWLTRLDPSLKVTVVERDFSYAQASSALSAASIRQQFSAPINIRISQASIAFLHKAAEELECGDERPDIMLREHGYLYLAGVDGAAHLRAAHTVQKACGSDIALLDPAELKRRFGWLNTSDLSLGSLGLSGEGWFDGYALLTAFARKARRQGARYVNAEVQGFTIEGSLVTEVFFSNGSRIGCSHVVNAAGPWARRVAAMAGLELPVFARRRTVYVIACPSRMHPFPLLIDPAGFWIRPDGTKFIAGLSPAEDLNDQPLEPDYDAFEDRLWPALAHRIPAFEAVKLERAWAGYFEMNTFDHNAILGPHDSLTNFLFMNGFSGHGMQQAPVIGRAVAEFILHGRFTSIDLSELLFSRITDNRPLPEANVIG